jgi:Flp pilus assembly protein TadG
MKRRKFRKGQMAVLFTLVVGTLLGVIALCADVGVMYYIHVQLQKGSDAAALAGASYENGVAFPSGNVDSNCTTETDDAQKAACTYGIKNSLATDAKSLKMTENVAPFPTPNIQVTATKSNLPYMFGRVIGLTTYTVAAVATAANIPASMVGGGGLFPMGMQCTSPCTLDKLKPGAPVPFDVKFTPAYGSAPGNWQWLDNVNGGGGASGLTTAITNGMSGTFTVGGNVTSLPGNKANGDGVKSAFSTRFTSTNCPSSIKGINQDACNGGTPSPGNPCLVTVPAVDYGGVTGAKTMPIEAFAQVYIEPGSTSSNITACYVKQVDPSAISGDPNATNLGSTIIRLYQ